MYQIHRKTLRDNEFLERKKLKGVRCFADPLPPTPMPKKKTQKKARKTNARRKTKRKVVRKARKAVRKTVRKAKRTATRARKAAAAKPRKAPRPAKGPKPLGKIIHYYDKIGVGIVKLSSPLTVGERVLFRRGAEEFEQQVSSMQIDHEPVLRAGKGAVIGLKVDRPVRDGALVLPL